jgi:hypothetical protein
MAKSILDELKSILDPESYIDVLKQLDESSSTMLNQFGQAQSMAQTLRESMADATKEVLKLGGDMNKVLETQQQLSEGLGRSIILSAEANRDLFASSQVTGQSVKEIVSKMADVGISSLNATEQMKNVVDVARESGVNAQIVSDKVLTNMNTLNKFNFEGGVTGLAKMAAQATALRIDMYDTLNFAEKVFDPDGAIEVAAAMQRLGVAQSDLLDPLKLMDLSQNDPAELQNQIVKMSQQFVQMGKDGHFEIMPGAKRQLREISKAMDIPYEQLTKMALGSADLDKKLKEIRFPDTFSEEQKTLIANMSEMKGGEYVIRTAEGKEKKVTELGPKEIEALEKMATTAPPTMEELAKDQLTYTKLMEGNIASLVETLKLGMASSKPAGKAVGIGRDVTTSLTKIPPKSYSPEGIREGIDKITSGGGTLQDFATYLKSDLKESFVNAQVEIDKLNKKYPEVTEFFNNIMGNRMSNVVRQGQDVLKLPGQEIQLLPEDTFAAFTKGSQVLSNLGNNNNTTPTSTPTNSKVDVNHTLNINISAPSHVNTNQLVEMFKDTGVSQALGVAVKEAFNNGGLTAPTSNKQKLLNPNINAYG